MYTNDVTHLQIICKHLAEHGVRFVRLAGSDCSVAAHDAFREDAGVGASCSMLIRVWGRLCGK